MNVTDDQKSKLRQLFLDVFTEDAQEFARGTECRLIDRPVLIQWLK